MIVVPPYYLSAEDYETLKLIADIIIPGNGPDEPGASAVGTVNFIDSEFGNMSENEREELRKAIALFHDYPKKSFGKELSDLNKDEISALFKKMHTDTASRLSFLLVRSLCIMGFYSDYADPWYDGIGVWAWMDYGGKGISGLNKDWSFLEIYRRNKRKTGQLGNE